MIDILIQGDIVFTGTELIRDGYVYISDGHVRAVGPGLPPEDLTYATLILGGPGRAVLPAIPWPVDPLGYMRKTVECRPLALSCEERRSLSGGIDLYLPAIMEAHMAGIGMPLIVAPHPSIVARIRDAVGGEYGALIPEECGPLEGYSGVLPMARPTGWDSVCPRVDLCRARDPYTRAVELAKSLGWREYVIKEGVKSMIAIYNLREPPLLGIRISTPEDAAKLYTLGATVESLIAGGDILVEVGEHLMIVEKHLNAALKSALHVKNGEQQDRQ